MQPHGTCCPAEEDAPIAKPTPKLAKVTLQEVARRAQVSPMTVSNYVNGKHGAMSQATRERVADAVAQLGYRPDTAGRSLRSARQLSIGMIVVDESPLYLSDGSTTQAISGLGTSLNARGYTLQLEGLPARELARSTLLSHLRSDGLCVLLSGAPAARRAMLEQVLALNQPVVVLYERLAAGPDACCVLQDDRAGGSLLARHVIGRGARRLLLVKMSLNRWKAVDEREAAILAAAKGEPDTTVERVGCGAGSFAEVQAAVTAAIERHGLPDAIMAMTDQIGIAVLKLMKAKGIAVPGRVKVTGFNGFEFWQYSDPVLTTVRSPAHQLGQIAGQEMIARLEQGAFAKPVIKLPVELVVGETT
ncbi:MAG: LacI family DNA-binding transcriptional regulator [Pseudomonadota bacterium]